MEAIDEAVTEQVSRPNPLSVAFGVVGHAIAQAANEGDSNVTVDRKSTYRRYKVALEQGEQITLRSYVSNIGAGTCVRVWILGPGISPVYWYAPDASEIEVAQGWHKAVVRERDSMQTSPNPTPQSDAFRSALYAPAHSPPGRERVLLSVPRLMPLSAIRRCLRKFTARYAARFYPSFRMGVFYRVESKRVVVLAVLHTARDPRVWPQPLGSAR